MVGGQKNGMAASATICSASDREIARSTDTLIRVGQDDGGEDAWGGSVGGSFGGLSWDTGYETSRNASNDWNRFGAFGGYAMGPGTVYAYYEDRNTDDNTGENDSLLFGYSHSVGTNTKVIVEYQHPDSGQKRTALAVRVDF